MGIFGWIKGLFAGGSGGSGGSGGAGQAPADPNALWFHFRCQRCGQVVRIRVDKRNDLNRAEEGPGALLLRKEVMDARCFQLMSAEIWLDSGYRVVTSAVSGGELISQEEYEASIAPPASDETGKVGSPDAPADPSDPSPPGVDA